MQIFICVKLPSRDMGTTNKNNDESYKLGYLVALLTPLILLFGLLAVILVLSLTALWICQLTTDDENVVCMFEGFVMSDGFTSVFINDLTPILSFSGIFGYSIYLTTSFLSRRGVSAKIRRSEEEGDKLKEELSNKNEKLKEADVSLNEMEHTLTQQKSELTNAENALESKEREIRAMSHQLNETREELDKLKNGGNIMEQIFNEALKQAMQKDAETSNLEDVDESNDSSIDE